MFTGPRVRELSGRQSSISNHHLGLLTGARGGCAGSRRRARTVSSSASRPWAMSFTVVTTSMSGCRQASGRSPSGN